MAATKGTRHGNGAGSGPGWGGPAKGAGHGGPEGSRPDFEPANQLGAGRGHESAAGMDKRARDDERRERLKDKLDDLAMHATSEVVQMQASVALLNRIDGMPRQNTVVEAVERGYIDAPPKAKTMEEWIARLSIPARNDAGM